MPALSHFWIRRIMRGSLIRCFRKPISQAWAIWSASGRRGAIADDERTWKSDSAIVAERPTNKAGRPAEEPEERRAETEGNAVQQSTRRAQNRESVSQALDRIRQAARQRKKEKFAALLHHISPEHLEAAFYELKENAAPGVDGVTWRAYEEGLDPSILDLHSRLHKGAYRALPSRRVYIPKPDGRQRPLAVAALEDKIVQRATIGVMNAIYEEDFLGFSYGFRPKRGQHDLRGTCQIFLSSWWRTVAIKRALEQAVAAS